MSYKNWFDNHAKKHKEIINKLSEYTDDEIIEYFNFENMVLKEPSFCLLYKDSIKCHEMKELNCYMCGCSNFRLTDIKSYCDINSKYGSTIESKDGFIHQDCSGCQIPHGKFFIKKNFNRDWKIMMKVMV